MDRRGFLTQSLAMGCSLAASPLVTPVAFASAPGEARLVVLILRGAMDGLGAVMPYGDPGYAALRGALPEGAVDLGGFYALHPGLAPLEPLWRAGQLGFVHAVSTPYRDKRSHFDGQDWLEAGISDMSGGLGRDGWLNRMLPLLGGARADTAYAIGNDAMAVLHGPAPVARWSPDTDLTLSPQALRLAQLVMQDDPAMARALATAFDLADSDGDPVAFTGSQAEMMSMMRADAKAARGSGAETRMAEFAAARLREDARIASFSINGWDTHANQARGLTRSLDALSQTILTLKGGLGDAWDQTAVVAVTEFGRTVRLNGTKGTDHGTGGAMILAGGAVRGGQVVSQWPGLAEADLYERRDLMPTRDLRAHLGWIMRGLFGLDGSDIAATVFPGLDLGADPKLLL
ncbi:DUF1501 domain-containing protein [Tropicibacter naphthalenivorans]|uniref:Twin-arginine translocation pathway signal n=1 Tax=Tropicibacter naphthalenivorans TaxID=441103 RepID=A0A0P1FZ97_9RHOB|nr:DUF1501 domain-containing protein [Tropicibacter naphthalenivorans]CUH74704.1 hypothetical protein TRN7648_00039 [Tropicibacter naphthalenivorans]SMC49677.1 Tat (twin-arginine translocation) pathway signal sequence [Tropicibacter naphthalenivorans]